MESRVPGEGGGTASRTPSPPTEHSVSIQQAGILGVRAQQLSGREQPPCKCCLPTLRPERSPGAGGRPNCCLSGRSLSSHCLSTSAGAPSPSVCCSCRVGPELLRSPSPRCWFQPPAPPGLRTPLPCALLHEEAGVRQGH